MVFYVYYVTVEPASSPPGDYSQYFPSRDLHTGFLRLGPPLLPPHLLETVLNKDVANHVSLYSYMFVLPIRTPSGRQSFADLRAMMVCFICHAKLPKIRQVGKRGTWTP